MNEELKETFIRADLNATTTDIFTAFRLSRELREFIQLLIDRGNEIEAIQLDLNDEAPNRVGWNIVFAIKQKGLKNGINN